MNQRSEADNDEPDRVNKWNFKYLIFNCFNIHKELIFQGSSKFQGPSPQNKEALGFLVIFKNSKILAVKIPENNYKQWQVVHGKWIFSKIS